MITRHPGSGYTVSGIRRSVALAWIILALAIVMTGCADDDFPGIDEDDTADGSAYIMPEEQSFSVGSKASYLTLNVARAEGVGAIAISSDCDWIHPESDTLATDGFAEFFIERDEEQLERHGKIRFTTVVPDGREVSVTCDIAQSTDDGSNAEIPAASSMRVGYGYNVFGVFQNDASVMDPIINEALIADPLKSGGLIEHSLHADMQIEKTVARTLDEMAYLLTEQEEKVRSGVRGASKTVKIHEDVATYSADEQQFGHITMSKSVAMRSIDLGVLNYLLSQSDDILSPGFRKVRDAVIASPDKATITRMLKSFGTHLVVYAEAGASLDLSINFSRRMKGTLSMRTEDFCDYFFKNKSSDFLLSDGKIADLTSKITPGTNCIVTGGRKSAREALIADIKAHGYCSNSIMTQWIESVNASDLSSLEPVNFQLVPIWSLFPTSCASAIIKEVNNLASQSNNQYSAATYGSDYYHLSLGDMHIRFDNYPWATLVQAAYVSEDDFDRYVPVLEICNEYVPHIRSDKRVTIYYALRNGRPFHGAGLFPGDGEGHPPAWLTFSEGEVYVKPIPGYDGKSQINDIYYLHGNIYTSNYGIDAAIPESVLTQPVYCRLRKQYPIVKIGSGYWTRSNISESLGFAKKETNGYGETEYKEYEVFGQHNTLYAHIFKETNPDVLAKISKSFGADTDPVYGERTLWYLPRQKDVWNLKEYVDDNPRELLAQRRSGFEASFDGCYGTWDLFSTNPFNRQDFYYKDEYCLIPCKDSPKEESGAVLVLSKNYTLQCLDIDKAQDASYPVRLYRTSYFKYTVPD